MRRLLFLLAGCIVSLPAFACLCELPELNEKNAGKYELIFLGKVDAVSSCNETSVAQFSVQKLFKGKCYLQTDVKFNCSSDCAMNFTVGETWLIYADYEAYGKPIVEFCSFSRVQVTDGKEDYNTATHGKSFAEESAWLEKTYGLQPFSEKTISEQQHHENIIPKGYTVLWYLGGGFLALIALYFVSKKFLR